MNLGPRTRSAWLWVALCLLPSVLFAGPPKPRSKGVDAYVEDVTLDRYDFRRGEPVTIMARVGRAGTAGSLEVRCFIDAARVDEIAQAVTATDTIARFEWIASFDAEDSIIIVGAYVEPVDGEENVENNGLWVVYDSVPDGRTGRRIGRRYAGDTHRHLTLEAIKQVNIPELSLNAASIANAAVQEDQFPDVINGASWFFGLSSLWTRHFWDVDGGELGSGLWGRDGACLRAKSYLYGWPNHQGAIELYKKGNKTLAYEYLGRAVHLMQDVCTPAHVHLDSHMIDDEETEKWGKTHCLEYSYEMAGRPYDGETLYAIMQHGAQLADSLPSDDNEGDTLGMTDSAGWTPAIKRNEIISWNSFGWDQARPDGMKALMDRAMPSAIAHTSGVLRLFWRATHPGEALPVPAGKSRDPWPLPAVR